MLASLKEVLEEGKKRNIAIGNFNTPNLETLNAILDAAEELDLPVIIAHAQCHEEYAPIDRMGPVMVELAKRSKVKVCVHLDHGEDFEYCKRAIALGFTSIMIDYSTLPYEENAKGTREVVDYAHARGVDVEAELGQMPSREGGAGDSASNVNASGQYTDPDLVNDYLEKTGVDVLAIAFGTAHGIYKTKPVLNMNVIKEVRKRTNVPLVMHGGSGVSHEQYREAIESGINKINYYSYMSYDGYAAAKATAEGKEADFFHVLALNAQNAMKENALVTMKVFAGIKE